MSDRDPNEEFESYDDIYQEGHDEGYLQGESDAEFEAKDAIDEAESKAEKFQKELDYTRKLLDRIIYQTEVTGRDVTDYEYLKSIYK